MNALERLQLEHDLLAEMGVVEQQVLDCMRDGDWSKMADLALELERIAGQLNLAMARGFYSEDVSVMLNRLIDLYKKGVLIAKNANNILKQVESDLQTQRFSIITRAPDHGDE